ncbi:MAG: leucyl aminopeptidase [Chloroflexi bacterium]|nr:leucyl aminopeptidase [Chloroflexota bacterium]
MRIDAQSGGSIGDARVDCIVVTHFEGDSLSSSAAAVDAALGGVLTAMIERKEIKGSLAETTSIQTLGRLPASRVIVAGLGKRTRFTPEALRRAAGASAKGLRKAAVASAAFELPAVDGSSAPELARAVVEGLLLATYSFNLYFSSERPALRLEHVTLIAPDGTSIDAGIRLGEVMAAGTNYARDLINEPPNVLNPAEMAKRAQSMAAEKGLTSEVFGPDELERRGMRAILAVGRGSANEPRLIALQYKGDPDGKHPTLGLVGKGITFDTGGISLKPGADMHLMKTDMGGAAVMLGAMHAIAELRPNVNVTMLVASAENMPDGTAYRPGDILRAMNGKTIEVQNTDAEGRLVLADALSYATELGLAPIVDAATLTGACSVALGPFYSGLFSNDDVTLERLVAASKTAGERLWPMPMDPDFRPMLDSSCADMRNVGGREGGAITAAMFLAEFVGEQPWAHLDIAPTAFADNESDYYAKGLGTGHPVRSLVQLALDIAAS